MWGEEGQEEKEGEHPASFCPPGLTLHCSQSKAGAPFPPIVGLLGSVHADSSR